MDFPSSVSSCLEREVSGVRGMSPEPRGEQLLGPPTYTPSQEPSETLPPMSVLHLVVTFGWLQSDLSIQLAQFEWKK